MAVFGLSKWQQAFILRQWRCAGDGLAQPQQPGVFDDFGLLFDTVAGERPAGF